MAVKLLGLFFPRFSPTPIPTPTPTPTPPHSNSTYLTIITITIITTTQVKIDCPRHTYDNCKKYVSMYFEKGRKEGGKEKGGEGEEPPLNIYGFVPTNKELVREGLFYFLFFFCFIIIIVIHSFAFFIFFFFFLLHF